MNIDQQILNRLQDVPNILLYGPPGTGKTYAMKKLQSRLEESTTAADPEDLEPGSEFAPDEVEFPFLTEADEDDESATDSFPGEIKTAWMTFHQDTGYEDFILGLRPEPDGGGVSLKPRAGTLLSLAEHAKAGNTSILFIDEINRANVPKVFGQFISVMESDFRLSEDGTQSSDTIGLSLPQVNNGDSIEDPIRGEEFNISVPYEFPQNLYIVAAMNSLDRSTEPLDSALMRRFEQIRVFPDYENLADQLETDFEAGLDLPHVEDTTAEQLSIALLHRVNTFLQSTLGEDFQIGEWYFSRVIDASEEERMAELIRVWDGRVIPKLRELYRSREDQLAMLFKIDRTDGLEVDNYPYRRIDIEEEWETSGIRESFEFRPLTVLEDENEQKEVLYHLATFER
ncbi:AAA family ATPase [Haloarcula sp. Atlit-120R]|uniref:AAA family ATPase n=1 Tax=Haloarcula sp. Atlit-120R TaxID=2282135 RepID=UPI000EF27351|nr:AAA family ATPase [Haloarcula sp. Atlit-120R]RLM33002.1 AAA family ATPase [Haloarcula sp. Atlit-120R]